LIVKIKQINSSHHIPCSSTGSCQLRSDNQLFEIPYRILIEKVLARARTKRNESERTGAIGDILEIKVLGFDFSTTN